LLTLLLAVSTAIAMYEYFQLFSEITVEISGFFQVKSFLR